MAEVSNQIPSAINFISTLPSSNIFPALKLYFSSMGEIPGVDRSELPDHILNRS